MFCGSNSDVWNAYLPKEASIFLFNMQQLSKNNEPKHIQIWASSDFTLVFLQCCIDYFFPLQWIKKKKQKCFALTLGLREVGISLYYHIKMPLVQPRKLKNWYTFQSVNWNNCGNAILVWNFQKAVNEKSTPWESVSQKIIFFFLG